MTRDLTGIGECMIELSDAGGGLLRKGYAGDVVNTLWYARKSLPKDVRTRFFTGIGEDPSSVQMTKFLNAAGIDTSASLVVEGRRPGLYMIHLDGAERSFSYWRESSAARLLATDRDRLQTVIEDAGAIYFSGITLAILPASEVSFLLDQLGRAARSGKPIAFDPNIRPALWASQSEIVDTVSAAASVSTLVLPSFDDEAGTFGDETPAATAERYHALGTATVVVKNGADAISVLTDDGLRTFEALTVDNPVDTTGAGDSFNGAFLASWLRDQSIEEAVLAAQKCAGKVICRHGALI